MLCSCSILQYYKVQLYYLAPGYTPRGIDAIEDPRGRSHASAGVHILTRRIRDRFGTDTSRHAGIGFLCAIRAVPRTTLASQSLFCFAAGADCKLFHQAAKAGSQLLALRASSRHWHIHCLAHARGCAPVLRAAGRAAHLDVDGAAGSRRTHCWAASG